MNLDPNEEEIALVATIGSICEDHFSIAQLRESEGRLDRDSWRLLGDTGVFSTFVDPAKDGLGLGLSQAILIFEVLGKFLVPGPVIASVAIADIVGDSFPEIAKGGCIAGVVDESDSPIVIENFEDLDLLLRVGPSGIELIEASEIRAIPLRNPFDPYTPVAACSQLPAGRIVGDAKDSELFRLRFGALAGAFLLGIGARTVDLAVEFAKSRYQFSRPIGSFQAIKHLLADAFVRAELSRAQLYFAGASFDDRATGDFAGASFDDRATGDFAGASFDDHEVVNCERAVIGARMLCSEAAIANSRTCIQVHGGMGFTWEVDAHLYLKRAVVLSNSLNCGENCLEQLSESFYNECVGGKGGANFS